jgi:hypothetical protein
VLYIGCVNQATVIKKSFTYLEATEEKRDKYQEAIKEISDKDIVYIDETGIEMNICKDRG